MPSIVKGLSHPSFTPSHVIGLLLILGVSYALYTVLFNIFLHPLRKYPGPKLWAASRLPYACTVLSGQSHRKIHALHEKYGDVIRVAPDELAFIRPDAWNAIIGHRKKGQGENGKDPDFWQSQKHSIISSNRENHGRIRRLLAHGFSAQAMMDQQPLIQDYVTLLMQKLSVACKGGEAPVEMTSWYNWTTFDIIGDLAFGEPFGCLQDSSYHPWVALIFDRIRGTSTNSVLGKFPFGPFFMKLLVSKTVAQNYHAHIALTQEKVAKRLAMTDARNDFMAAMTNTRENLKLSHAEIVGTSSTLIIAGSETTATTLSAVTYLLATNKSVLRKVTEEVRSSFKDEDEIDLLSVQKLSYMMAVLNETLRLYPPVPGTIPRRAPAEGDTIYGQYIPADTVLGIWQWAMYHSSENFTLPESFIPERWLDDKRFVNDRKEAFQPFSFGPRNCLGRNLAYAEMRLILARMVWNFDFELDPRSQDWLQKSECFILWKKPELYVRLIPRGHEQSNVLA